jgi:hypothetical protein
VTAPNAEPTRSGEIATDLVEYLLVLVPTPDALSEIGPELVRIVSSSAVRVLDVAMIAVDEEGSAELLDTSSNEVLDTVRQASECYGVLLSRHDIDLVALALGPGDCAIVIVAEDRWAEPIAVAARAVGGEVRAGERIARERVEAALARSQQYSRHEDEEET